MNFFIEYYSFILILEIKTYINFYFFLLIQNICIIFAEMIAFF